MILFNFDQQRIILLEWIYFREHLPRHRIYSTIRTEAPQNNANEWNVSEIFISH